MLTKAELEYIANPNAKVYGAPVRTAIAYCIENFAEDIGLTNLAEAVSMTRFSFCRRFVRECGITPMRWLWDFRTLLAAELIRRAPHWSMTAVAFACGFTSSAHFSRAFRACHKQCPTSFRKKAMIERKMAVSGERGLRMSSPFECEREVVIRAAYAALRRANECA